MKFLFYFLSIFLVSQTLADETLWEEFKVKYPKNFNDTEDKQRFKIFEENLRKIKKHNIRYEKGEVSYFLTTTKFADYTEEELMSLSKYVPRSNFKSLGTFKSNPNVIIPESVDWRKQNAVREVKNQFMYQCASCWSFSTTGALEGQLTILKNQTISLSEQELIDCSGDYGNQGCYGGIMEWAFSYVQDNGLSSEEQYPYLARQDTCKSYDLADKAVAPIKGYVVLEQTEDALVEAVASVGPISVAVTIDMNWHLYAGGIFDHDSCPDYLNHGVLVVGYGTEEKDYWIIKNSFGEDWGENGYIRLVRGKKQCGVNRDCSYPVL